MVNTAGMLKDKFFYEVSYLLKLAKEGYGEYNENQEVRICSLLTETNDLNEIFTDLFDKHRMEGIIGIEILSVDIRKGEVFVRENIRYAH